MFFLLGLAMKVPPVFEEKIPRQPFSQFPESRFTAAFLGFRQTWNSQQSLANNLVTSQIADYRIMKIYG